MPRKVMSEKNKKFISVISLILCWPFFFFCSPLLFGHRFLNYELTSKRKGTSTKLKIILFWAPQNLDPALAATINKLYLQPAYISCWHMGEGGKRYT